MKRTYHVDRIPSGDNQPLDKYTPTYDDSRKESLSVQDNGCTAHDSIDTCPHCEPKTLRNSKFFEIFIYSSEDFKSREIRCELDKLQSNHHYLCFDSTHSIYGCSVFENYAYSLHESRIVIIVVTLAFLKDPLCLFYCDMAVLSSVQEQRHIICVLDEMVKKESLPKALLNFPIVSTQKYWFHDVLNHVKKADRTQPTAFKVCTNEGHLDISSIQPNNPSTTSDPTPFRTIPDRVKKCLEIYRKELKISENVERALKQTVEVLPQKVDYDANMKFFHSLKYQNKKIFEVGKFITRGQITLQQGDIIEVIENGCHYKICSARYQTFSIPKNQIELSPVTQEVPSICWKKLQSPISWEENDRFKQELMLLKKSVYAAKTNQVAQENNNSFELNQGDILQVVERRNSIYKVKNCRNQTGLIRKSDCELQIASYNQSIDRRLSFSNTLSMDIKEESQNHD